ncbi:MAG: hypothetical protein ACI316_06940 [Lactimicrobium massiliense]
MHLGMSKSKNSTSLYVLKSTYSNGFHSTKIVEKLGTVEELQKKLNGEDPIAWAKKHIEEMNRLEKEERREVTEKYSPVKQIEKNEQRTFNGGYLFLQQVYNTLGFPQLCKDIQRRHHLNYNLDAILSRMIYSRLIYPDAGMPLYDASRLFIEQPDFTPHQIIRATEVLAEEADRIQETVYANTRRIFGHSTSTLYFDATTCLYEAGTIKSRQLPVIPMDLYFDGNFMPICYSINPEHLKEVPQTRLEKQLRDSFRTSQAISFTDSGIVSGASATFKDWGIPNGYIMQLSYDNMRDEEKRAAQDPTGWSRSDTAGLFDLSKLRKESEITNPSRFYYKEMKVHAPGGLRRVIITYSNHYGTIERLERELNMLRGGDPLLFQQPANMPSYADGIAVYVTNTEIPAKDIIKMEDTRSNAHNIFRILSMEIPDNTDGIPLSDEIQAHFITCFCTLTVVSALVKRLDMFGRSGEVLEQLRRMNFMKIQLEGYVPLYTRTDLTDLLHDNAGFRTDHQIISKRQMDKILKASV